MKAFPWIGPTTLLAALVLTAAADQPAPAGSPLVALRQDAYAAIDLAATSGAGESAVRPSIVVLPRHGRLAILGKVAIYTPFPGYFGRDSVALDQGQGTVTIELRVLPEVVPLAGRFKELREAAALYDNRNEAFLICSAVVRADLPLDCQWIPLAVPTGKALLPLAWPNRDGYDQPALFDFATGELRILAFAAGELVEQQRIFLPEATGAWPVIGDWSGRGVRELALISESGDVISLDHGTWHKWPASLETDDGDLLLWPILFPREGERDAIAMVDRRYGHLTWLGHDASGAAVQGFEPSLAYRDFQKPLVWTMTPRASIEPSPEIFFLAADGLELIPGAYSLGKPQTIPVKFPDDPPGP